MKNSIEGLKGRFEQAGKQKSVNSNTVQLKLFSSRKNKKKKRMKENEKNLRDVQGIIEHTSICMRESQEGRRERKGQKNI